MTPMRYLILLLLLLISLPETSAEIEAEAKAEIRRLEKMMTRVQQESQSTYQQFLMTQELRRNEMSESPTLTPTIPTGKSIPVPNYQDLNRLRLEKQERIEKYTADLDRLYARYKALENEREALYEQIKSLEQKPVEE